MKYFTLLLSFFIFSGLQAQYSTYDLNDYARPELKRETLILGLDGSIISDDDSSSETKYNFSTDGRYNGYFNKKFQQRDVQANYQLALRTGSDFSSLVNWTDTRRNYNEKNNNYLLLGYGIGGSLRLNDRSGDVYSLSPNAKIGYGTGRIEFINDAWHAATIAESLNDKGIGNILDHDQITELAYKIGEIKNFRKLDFRNEFISELEMLSQALIDIGFIDGLDITAFAHLQDLYRYESFVTRRSGRRIEGSLSSNYQKINFSNDFSPTDIS